MTSRKARKPQRNALWGNGRGSGGEIRLYAERRRRRLPHRDRGARAGSRRRRAAMGLCRRGRRQREERGVQRRTSAPAHRTVERGPRPRRQPASASQRGPCPQRSAQQWRARQWRRAARGRARHSARHSAWQDGPAPAGCRPVQELHLEACRACQAGSRSSLGASVAVKPKYTCRQAAKSQSSPASAGKPLPDPRRAQRRGTPRGWPCRRTLPKVTLRAAAPRPAALEDGDRSCALAQEVGRERADKATR
jgi:hypothetical protein